MAKAATFIGNLEVFSTPGDVMRFFAVIRSATPIVAKQRAAIQNRVEAVHESSETVTDGIKWCEFERNNVYTTFLFSGSKGVEVAVEDSSEYFAGFFDNGSAEEVSESYFLKNGRLYLSDAAPGTFLAASFRKADGSLVGFASRPCAMPGYYYNGEEIFVMSSDAIVVAVLAELLDRKSIRLSREYAIDYLSWGYTYREQSPFEDVQALPLGTYLVVRGIGNVVVREYSRTNLVDFDGASTSERARCLSESLAASIDRIPESELVNLRLSGGKDSRVLLSALAGGNKKFVTETRGKQSDLEVAIASELANRVGAKHIVSSVAMASPNGLLDSTLMSIQRMAGHLSAEPQQIMFEGARPQHVGQYLMMGHSHIQRGGFARTMRNDPKLTLGSLKSQCTPFVSDELKNLSDVWVSEWYSGQSFANYIEPLYELHVRKRASYYLVPQYRDYSNVAKLHYPLIGHDFVSKCDALSVFDRVSEQVIFLAAVDQLNSIMDVPLCDDLWNFDRNGKGEILPSQYEARTSEFKIPEVGGAKSGGDLYNSASVASLNAALKYIADSDELGFLLRTCSAEVGELLSAKDYVKPLEQLKSKDRLRFDLLRRFIWRMYAVSVWSTRSWLKA